MRKAYIGKEPEKGIVIPIEDAPLYHDEKEYICYASKPPKYAPENFTLVLPKLTPALRKKLVERGYRIYAESFNIKRIFIDQNRLFVYNDIGNLESEILNILGKNFIKLNVNERETLSRMGELLHSVNNDFLKGAIIFGITPKDLKVIHY